MRTAFFIDGYNLFYGLLAGTPYKWLDVARLLSEILRVQDPSSAPASFYYYTSDVIPRLASQGIKSKEAQDTYIRALKSTGIEVIKGSHRLDARMAPTRIDGIEPCRQTKSPIWHLEEKQTDVNIAIGMYRLAAQQALLASENPIQQIVLVGSDSDMTPALQAIRTDFPEITVGLILPIRKDDRPPNKGLMALAHWTRTHITESELQASQFPNRVPATNPRKRPADKPSYW